MVQALRAACRHLLVHLAVDHFEAAIEFGDALVAAQEVLALARRVVLALADGHRAAHVVEVRARPAHALVDHSVLGEREKGSTWTSKMIFPVKPKWKWHLGRLGVG